MRIHSIPQDKARLHGLLCKVSAFFTIIEANECGLLHLDPTNHGFLASICVVGGGLRVMNAWSTHTPGRMAQDFKIHANHYVSKLRANGAETYHWMHHLMADVHLPSREHALDTRVTNFIKNYIVPPLHASALVDGPNGLLQAVMYVQTMMRPHLERAVNAPRGPEHQAHLVGPADDVASRSQPTIASFVSTYKPSFDPRLRLKADSAQAKEARSSALSPLDTPTTGASSVVSLLSRTPVSDEAPITPLNPQASDPSSLIELEAKLQEAKVVSSPLLSLGSPISEATTPLAASPARLEPPPFVAVAAQMMQAPTPEATIEMPAPSAKSLGKRRAPVSRSPSPQPLRRRTASPVVAASLGNPSIATFSWSRNERAITSDFELMNALICGPAAGAAGALYSARLGTLWIESAPLEVFDMATSNRVPSAHTAAMHLPINGWDIRCTPAQGLALLTDEDGPTARNPLSIELQGAAVQASAAMLRALIRVPTSAALNVFEGSINGRSLSCSVTDLKALIGPEAAKGSESPGNGEATVTLTFNGNTLQAPAAALRQLVLTQPAA